MKLSRRQLPAGMLALGFVAFAEEAHAGSYLDRAALLLFEGSTASDYLSRRLYDDELALIVQKSAFSRIKIAQEMLVPKEVVQAHPHLLLTLEHHGRAATSAVERAPKEFLRYFAQAREDEQLFRAVLKQLGWELPEFK